MGKHFQNDVKAIINNLSNKDKTHNNIAIILDIMVAKSTFYIILLITGILSGLAIIGGIFAIYKDSLSPTKINLLGFEVSTGSIGVAFTALGLIIMYFVVKNILQTLHKLAISLSGGGK